MKYHVECLLFELIKLYQESTKEDTISLDRLRNAFYALQDLINKRDEVTETWVFEDALEALQDCCSESIRVTDDELIIQEDLEILYDEILLSIEKLSAIDASMDTYAANIKIYQELQIPIPLTETSIYFEINLQIMQIYLMLANYELKGKENKILRLQLHFLLTSLQDIMEKTDRDKLNKLKVACAYYNGLYLSDENAPHLKSWNIALFGNNLQLKSLGYKKLLEEISLRELELDEDEEREPIDELDEEREFMPDEEGFDESNDPDDYSDIEEEEMSLEDEVTLFLGTLLYDLNSVIKMFKTSLPEEIIEGLTIRAYLLLSLPELEDAESVFIKENQISRPIINPLNKTQSSFNMFYQRALQCSQELYYQDCDILKNSNLYTTLIISALFIRCLLKVSPNEDRKEQIKMYLTQENKYKNPTYSIATKLIDDIIFNENLDFSRPTP